MSLGLLLLYLALVGPERFSKRGTQKTRMNDEP
jgi:hypothetical protein